MNPAAPADAYPLIILLLHLTWAGFLVAASATMWRGAAPTGVDARRLRLAALGAALVALAAGLFLAPAPPMVSTYTGLPHITAAYRIAALDWGWAFSTDHPLAVPVFASLVVHVAGAAPETVAVAGTLLFAAGAAGTVLLGTWLFGALLPGLVAGLLFATLPLHLLFAGAETLSIGYAALAPWAVFFGLRLLAASPGRERLLATLGLATATTLILQSRPEAAAFLPLLALLPAAAGATRRALGRFVACLVAAALLSGPYLVLFVQAVLATGGTAGGLGLRHVPRIVLVTLTVVLGVVAIAGLAPAEGKTRRARLLPALPLFAALLAAGLAGWGWDFLSRAPVCFDPHCTLDTYRTLFVWHLNPKIVPLPAIFLMLAGLLSFRGRREARRVAFLVLWTGTGLAAASVKMTGELPFEGARTQLVAGAPLVLLAGLAAREAARPLSTAVRQALLLGLLLLPFYPAPLTLAARADFAQQREFAFFRDCVSRLPANATLYAPDDVVPVIQLGAQRPVPVDLYHLHRTDYLPPALGDEAGALAIRPLSQLGTHPGDDSCFFHSLNCYRNAGERLNPSCIRAISEWTLDPVCETTLPVRPYTSDFHEGTRITRSHARIGIYRFVRRKEVSSHAVP